MVSPSRPPDPSDLAVNKSTQPIASFAAVVRSRLPDQFPPIKLPPRQYVFKDGLPIISFTKVEVQPGKDRLQFAIVAKFSSGRLPINDIRRSLVSAWGHILIILLSSDDANKVLAHLMRKVVQSMFRLFRWSPDFHYRKGPTTTTAWVRLPGFSQLINGLGRLPIAVTQGHALNLIFPKHCHRSCKCKLHGHQLSNCRKVKPSPSELHEANISTKQRDLEPISCERIERPISNLEPAESQQIPTDWITVCKRRQRKGRQQINDDIQLDSNVIFLIDTQGLQVHVLTNAQEDHS
ncbi:hypothetical protein QQ045_033102 [Rhodiola kirilowii]